MKKVLRFLTTGFGILALTACGSAGNENTGDTGKDDQNSTGEVADLANYDAVKGNYEFRFWFSEVSGVKELTEKQIQDFCTKYPGINITATVEGVTEGDAASQMIKSVEDGADMFCFAQDQFSRLIQVNALSKLGTQASTDIKNLNTARAAGAATNAGSLYAYPLTDDNGYFMYYDKSIIQEDDIDTLEELIARCEANNRKFSFQIEDSGWYNASFFFGAGCKSEWTVDDDGEFTEVDDDFNSEKGLIALKGMQKLLKSSAYTNSTGGVADFNAAIKSAVVVSGTWDYAKAKELLGDNMGCAKLPTYTVDGKTYQLGSFTGAKLLGVKPQSDAKKGAVLHALAAYLTGKKCQMERFEQFGWGPSNLVARETKEVKENIAIAALEQQNQYAKMQGQIHGSWWSISKAYVAAAKEATTDAQLSDALTAYKTAIDGLFTLDTSGFIFVGAWNGWGNTDGNYKMTESNGVYTITVTVTDDMEYKGGRVVTPGSWDNDKGCTIVVPGSVTLADGGSDNNIVFTEAGSYKVTYDSNANTITLEKVA